MSRCKWRVKRVKKWRVNKSFSWPEKSLDHSHLLPLPDARYSQTPPCEPVADAFVAWHVIDGVKRVHIWSTWLALFFHHIAHMMTVASDSECCTILATRGWLKSELFALLCHVCRVFQGAHPKISGISYVRVESNQVALCNSMRAQADARHVAFRLIMII